MRLLIVLFLLLANSVNAQLNVERKKQLDSIVTNVDRKILTNLDSIHEYLHRRGRDDAERVFMFYGMISIHHKYDFKRLKEKRKATEYTPYYTAKRKKGICRDFAALFKELCDRSDIPCVVANGKVKMSLLRKIYEIVTMKYNPRHAWNIVKYRGTWKLMDPTWSQVYKTEKYYEKDSNGRKRYKGKVKRATRTYYDASPRAFYFDRNAAHPAYYLSNTIYTYKSSRKKYKRRKVLHTNYDYATVLDSLAANPNYRFSSKFANEELKYSKRSNYQYHIKFMYDYLDLKRTSFNPITLESCDSHLVELKKVLDYIRKDSGSTDDLRFEEHRLEIEEHKAKLKKNN